MLIAGTLGGHTLGDKECGIARHALKDDFKVHVRPSRMARAAHAPDQVTALDRLTCLDVERAQVAIAREIAIPMIDENHVSIADIVPTSHLDESRIGRVYRRASWRGKVNARMTRPKDLTDARAYRPNKVARPARRARGCRARDCDLSRDKRFLSARYHNERANRQLWRVRFQIVVTLVEWIVENVCDLRLEPGRDSLNCFAFLRGVKNAIRRRDIQALPNG